MEFLCWHRLVRSHTFADNLDTFCCFRSLEKPNAMVVDESRVRLDRACRLRTCVCTMPREKGLTSSHRCQGCCHIQQTWGDSGHFCKNSLWHHILSRPAAHK